MQERKNLLAAHANEETTMQKQMQLQNNWEDDSVCEREIFKAG